MDGERIGRMMDGYQSAVENDLRVMADTGDAGMQDGGGGF